jgi:phage tail sheath gpL-like
MTVPFNYIPAGNGVKVPLFYAEMDNSQAGYFSQNVRSLCIGQKLAGGSAAVNTPYIISSANQAVQLFGQGSMLARMVNLFRLSNPVGELWCIALADNAGGVANISTIAVTGPATAAGTINLYIAGQLVQIAVGSTDTANTIATNINTAINAAGDLPVTSTVLTNTVTMTCRWKGLTGNDIQVSDSYRGTAGGQALPTGVSLAYATTTPGTTNPVVTAAITAMGDDPYDFVIHPYNDSANLALFATEFGDSAGRWAWSRQVYGHCYTALRGTLGNLVTAGGLLNDPHHTVAAIDADCQHPVWEYAAAYGARNSVYIAADPARPTQTGQLTGIMAPRQGKKFLWSDRNSLLGYGIATSMVVSGVVQVERAITTYQKNTFGVTDYSYLDSETLHTAAYVLRNLASIITQKYARSKLANDGTRYSASSAMVTPAVIRGEMVAVYKTLENLGIVENSDLFAQYLIVERDITNPNRINVLFPPDYVNQLRIFAVLNQFRLQFPGT